MVLSPSKPFICFTLNDKTSYIYWHHVCFRFVFVVMDTCIFINDNESNIKIAFVNQSSEALGKQYTSLTDRHPSTTSLWSDSKWKNYIVCKGSRRTPKG